jgi:hypothetical protein
MQFDRMKARAWAVLTIFAAAALYAVCLTGWRKSLAAAIAFALALLFIVAIFAFWSLLRAALRRAFPPAPLWRKPRRCSALFEPELFATLQSRLDMLERDGRIALWQDRSTGQLWRSTDYDFEFTENRVFEPVAGKAGWQSSASDALPG